MAQETLHTALAASKLRRVIIESPCAAVSNEEWIANADYLNECLRDSIARGEAPYASHGIFAFSGAFEDADPEQREACMLAGFAWQTAAEAVIVYTDRGMSAGMVRAVELAAKQGITVEQRSIHTRLPNIALLTNGG